MPINAALPLIESESDIRLRTRRELCERLISLWAVAGSAFERDNDYYQNYIREFQLEKYLSAQESAFLLGGNRDDHNFAQFTWRLEAIYFLSWCGGLTENIKLPTEQSSLAEVMHLFPFNMESPATLENALSIRNTSEVLDWSDLLYRSHWALREAQLSNRAAPGGLDGGVIQEWHQAVNWFTHYGEEDDWDAVGTDT